LVPAPAHAQLMMQLDSATGKYHDIGEQTLGEQPPWCAGLDLLLAPLLQPQALR